MINNKSSALFSEAKRYIPGGVNSPVRAFKSVGGEPIFMKSAQGAYLYDVDGNQYIDYINSWGPMILGHGHPAVVEAILHKASQCLSFGAPTGDEIEFAKLITSIAPNVDKVRLVSSGTEACMSALRVARGFTGRNKFIKFEGCYHGHADAFLVKAGSGLATFAIQTVPGVTAGAALDTLTAPYNDLEAVAALFENHIEEIAAIIIEPVAGNMGCILPKEGFLKGLRELCDRYGALLIFDEVMTGFRMALGGVQERMKVDADLVTYGKVIGGGMPVGAFGGKKHIMSHLAPEGNIYQAGTLSGNPVAVASGMATINWLNAHPEIYQKLEDNTHKLKQGLGQALDKNGITHTINQIGSMISVHFGGDEVNDFTSASKAQNHIFNQYFHHMLKHGIYLPPSAYETWFVSDSINEEHIHKTVEATALFHPIES